MYFFDASSFGFHIEVSAEKTQRLSLKFQEKTARIAPGISTRTLLKIIKHIHGLAHGIILPTNVVDSVKVLQIVIRCFYSEKENSTGIYAVLLFCYYQR